MKKRTWGLVFLGLILFLISVGYFYTPQDPNQTQVLLRFKAPTWSHPLGTDHFGRDILSRIMVGGRVSLFIGFIAVSLGSLIGIILGLIGGYRGGLWDELLMRLSTSLQALPSILLALLLATVWAPGYQVVLWAIVVGNIPIFLRVTRNQVLKIKVQPYIEGAKAVGLGDFRIMFHHILPNLKGSLFVQFSVSLAGAILVESSLSYLGVGIQPPDPSWGRMLREAQSYASLAPWLVLAPGACIALTVIGFNLLGER